MTRQEEIKSLLKTLGIKTNWLADKLNMSSQTLNFILESQTKIDDTFYQKCKDYINNYQLEFRFIKDSEDSITLFDEIEARKTIGDRIRLFAKTKFGNSKKLAEALDISPQHLQQYISGTREPGAKTLQRLLKLGCDLNWLLGGYEILDSFRLYNLEYENNLLRTNFEKIRDIIIRLKDEGFLKE